MNQKLSRIFSIVYMAFFFMFFLCPYEICLAKPARYGALLPGLTESEVKIPVRGGQTCHALPLPKLRLLLKTSPSPEGEGTVLAPLLSRLSILTERVADPSEADAVLVLHSSTTTRAVASVLDPKGRSLSGRDFVLPAEEPLLEGYLSRLSRSSAISRLQGGLPFPRVDWIIHIYQPAEPGAPNALVSGDRAWHSGKTLTVTGANETVPLESPALLLFSFFNRMPDTYYVYLVNYTDDGLILPVLPPLGEPDFGARGGWGNELSLPSIRLELEASVEKLRLIVSRVPLDITSLAQQDLLTGSLPGKEDSQLPLALPEQFSTVEVVFVHNNPKSAAP